MVTFIESINIRKKRHLFIDTIEDKRAEAIYTLFEDEIETDAQWKKSIIAERKKYLRGEGKSYGWNEVKEMAMNKEKRNGNISWKFVPFAFQVLFIPG